MQLQTRAWCLLRLIRDQGLQYGQIVLTEDLPVSRGHTYQAWSCIFLGPSIGHQSCLSLKPFHMHTGVGQGGRQALGRAAHSRHLLHLHT